MGIGVKQARLFRHEAATRQDTTRSRDRKRVANLRVLSSLAARLISLVVAKRFPKETKSQIGVRSLLDLVVRWR